VGEEHLGELEPVIRQGPRGRVGGAGGEKGRREDRLVGAARAILCVSSALAVAARIAAGVSTRGQRRRRRPALGVNLGLVVDDVAERIRVQPGRCDNVGAPLLLEEEGEPERDVAAVWRAQCRGLALGRGAQSGKVKLGGRRDGDALTESREMGSRRWRGTTVTSSISQRNPTSEGTRPGGSGSAILEPALEGGKRSCRRGRRQVKQLQV